MHSFEENNVGLEELTEDSEEDKELKHASPDQEYITNGHTHIPLKREDR